jgi:hypothetical protein
MSFDTRKDIMINAKSASQRRVEVQAAVSAAQSHHSYLLDPSTKA